MVDDNRWVDDLVAAAHERFGLDDAGRIAEGLRPLGRLSTGVDRLRPEVVLTLDLAAGARLRLQRRLVAWTRDLVNELLAPLRDDSFASLGPAARGLLYQLEQGLGTVPVDLARAQLRDLEERDRQTLLHAGLRLGRHVIYSPVLLHPAAVRVRVALCQAFLGPDVNLAIPGPDTASLVAQSNIDDGTYAAIGFPVLGNLAIRADVLETVATRLASGARDGEVARRLGCSIDDAHAIRRALPAVRRPARVG
jgi:ATP-dependent RNA helicase SUPV3L1/SUV3